MAAEGQACKIDICEETVKVLEPRRSAGMLNLQQLINRFVMKRQRCLEDLWKIGVEDPKKFIHCLKVGFALTIVSVFYFMRPLYDALGGNTMWALMTVGLVFEYTVGATLSKSINRVIATISGGLLGIGINWITSHCEKQYEPVITGISVFIFGSLATFSRLIPSVKARFDYGAMVFILTFTFIVVSGYRVDKLVKLAVERISTIAIGASICILINMLVCPVWAGDQLRHQTLSNLENLANSVEGCVSEFFSKPKTTNIPENDMVKKSQGYKCLLSSQEAEESMEKFARWEPAHGYYRSRHPWKQYLVICAAARNCAYCIDNLNSCVNSEMQVKTNIKEKCTKLSFCLSEILKEMVIMIKTRIKSSRNKFLIEEMNSAAEDLRKSLLSLPPLTFNNTVQENCVVEKCNKSFISEVLAFGFIATLLIEIVARVEEIVMEVDKLATAAEFKIQDEMKSQYKESSECIEITERSDQRVTHVLEQA